MKPTRKTFAENLVKKAGIVPESAILDDVRFTWKIADERGYLYSGSTYMYLFTDKVKSGHILRIKFFRNPTNFPFSELKMRIQKLVPEGVKVEVRGSNSPYISLVIQLNYQERPW